MTLHPASSRAAVGPQGLGRRRALAFGLVLLLQVGALVTAAAPAQAAVVRPFTPTPRFAVNTRGDISAIGNTLMTCPTAVAGCTETQDSDATSGSTTNNGDFDMVYVDIDGAADATTFNHSSAELTTASLPAGAEVLWAGLYWGAQTPAAADPAIGLDPALRGRVRLAVPGGSFETVNASIPLDISGLDYQGFAEVTQQVRDAGAGTYQVANVQARTGNNTYAGWSLQVVYRDAAQPLRNLTVFDGYATIEGSDPVTIEVSGFETPPSGDVRSRLGLVTYEGDQGRVNDGLRFGPTSSPATNTPVGNTLSPPTDVWNSSITDLGARVTAKNPDYANQLGIDIDRFDVSGPSYLMNGATAAAIYLSTAGDFYQPGVVTLATELFAPRLDVTKTGTDLNGGDLEPGDTLEYEVGVVSSGDAPAEQVVLTDPIPDGTTYVAGSLQIGSGANAGAQTDAAGDDQGEVAGSDPTATVRLGSGATTSTGGTLAVAEFTSVRFQVQVDPAATNGTAIENAADVAYRSAGGLAFVGASNLTQTAVVVDSDLSVNSPTADPGFVQAGDSTTLTFQVTNLGPDTEPAPVLTFDLPAGATLVSATAGTGTCDLAGARVTCTLAAQAPGSSLVAIELEAGSASGTLTGTATVSGTNRDQAPGNNSASIDVEVNRAPVASADTATTPSATAVTVTVLTNDTDADGDTPVLAQVIQGTGGSATANGDGTITFTPDTTFRGPATFTYNVSDGRGGTSTPGTVTVGVANAGPVAGADLASTTAPDSVTVVVLGNDSDPNGDPLTVTVGAVDPAAGSAVVDGDGAIVFTPAAGFLGDVVFDYTVSDGTDSATASVTITVDNALPVAVDDDGLTTATNTALDIDVLANDTDANGDPAGGDLVAEGLSTPEFGTAVLNGDGTVSYTPDDGFTGVDTFTYRVRDADGDASEGSGTVTVTVANALPVAAADTTATPANVALSIAVLANDTDLNDSALYDDPLAVDSVTDPVDAEGAVVGAVVAEEDGTLTYVPPAGFVGDVTFTYLVTDSFGGLSQPATVTVNVAANDPLAADDTAVTDSGTAVTVDVLDNDTSPSGGELSVTETGGLAPGLGTLTIAEGGAGVTFTPAAGTVGEVTFTYTVSDGLGGSATGQVTVTVGNAAPTAADDEVATGSGTPVTVDVRLNDADLNGDVLTVTISGQPASGSAAVNADGTITYTPAASFAGSASFDYTISDGRGGSARATVTVVVANGAPVAADDEARTVAGEAVDVDVLANDGDVNGDALSVTIATAPADGRAVVNADGSVTYTPDAAFTGTDTFTYTVTDTAGATASASVTIVVDSGAPEPDDDAVTTGPGELVVIAVLDNDAGDDLRVVEVSQPQGGRVTVNTDGTVTFDPDTGFEGEANFTYTVSDGRGGTATATVTVTVAAAPARPDGYLLSRVSGPTRIHTAVQVSQQGFPSADTVVLARSDVYADALAGAPVAAQRSAPILLTASPELSPETAAEIDRLGATKVLLLGGTVALAPEVAAELAARGLTVERIGGADRFETAALLAATLGPSDIAYVVEGADADPSRGWPDALATSYLAAATGRPILLVTTESMPEATRRALDAQGVQEAVVVGGTAAVSDDVVDELADGGFDPRRVAGENRYETSAEVYREAVAEGLDQSTVWLGTGLNWPDSLTAGPVVGHLGQTMLLIDGATPEGSQAALDVLRANRDVITDVRLLGGEDAIQADVSLRVEDGLER